MMDGWYNVCDELGDVMVRSSKREKGAGRGG